MALETATVVAPEGLRRRAIAHLTSVHHSHDTRILLKECRTLADAGYSVTLIVPHDGDEEVQGVRIIGVPKPHDRVERFSRTIWHVYRAALRSNAELVHLHDPELLPIGMLLSMRGKRVVYDVHEDVPKDILDKEWLSPWLRRPVSWAARVTHGIATRMFTGIVAATPSIAKGFSAAKTATVQNFPLLGELAPAADAPYATRPPNAVYVGGISVHRGVREMVAAMSQLPPDLPARLTIAGTFDSVELHDEMRAHPGWQRVEDLGWVDRGGVRSSLAAARVGLVLFHPIANHVEAQPNKLFEYMSAGLPIIASDFPLWRQLIDGVGCGLVVDPLEPSAIADAIRWILEHPAEAEAMGRRGQRAIAETYNWQVEGQKLLDFYGKLLN